MITLSVCVSLGYFWSFFSSLKCGATTLEFFLATERIRGKNEGRTARETRRLSSIRNSMCSGLYICNRNESLHLLLLHAQQSFFRPFFLHSFINSISAFIYALIFAFNICQCVNYKICIVLVQVSFKLCSQVLEPFYTCLFQNTANFLQRKWPTQGLNLWPSVCPVSYTVKVIMARVKPFCASNWQLSTLGTEIKSVLRPTRYVTWCGLEPETRAHIH